MIDLLSSTVGGRVVHCNDEFFAAAANLLNESPPVWKEGEYTDRGKWMDGWETRRRRDPGHDWCILSLGIPGRVGRVVVDTSYFTGNYPAQFSLDACGAPSDDKVESANWSELIPVTSLEGDSVASFDVDDRLRTTYLRLNIFPDGGIARLRVEGEPLPALEEVCRPGHVDLAALVVGGVAIDASDTHYSQPSNLLRPNPPRGMWDGWETKRRRGPGHDWATFRLGLPGNVDSIVVDTTHFKGNSPGWISLDLSDDGDQWQTVLEEVAVTANTENVLSVGEPRHAAYARLSLHPDGGLARFRVRGRADRAVAARARVGYVNALYPEEAVRFFNEACASRSWVTSMVEARPYSDIRSLFQNAITAFEGLTEADWLEAFTGHPRIGERGDAFANREQTGVAGASRATLRDLTRVNVEYEQKFGFTYIVYATGKTADEMLAIARERLGSTRDTELTRASVEQRRITETRLRRMTCQEEQ
jgi:allantoicase